MGRLDIAPWARADLLEVEKLALRDRARSLGVALELTAEGPWGPYTAKVRDRGVDVHGYASAYAAGQSALGRCEP